MLYNVGPRIVRSNHGLISTVAYKLGPDAPPVYALEGSVAMAGGAVAWLQQQIHLFEKPCDVETMAKKSSNNDGVFFVPAFSGLFAPYWRCAERLF